MSLVRRPDGRYDPTLGQEDPDYLAITKLQQNDLP
jgi:hypothetical protein